jgi:hypothetical protein
VGHGDKIFTNPQQNLFFENALLWLGGRDSGGLLSQRGTQRPR